jgi:hypothetical protein
MRGLQRRVVPLEIVDLVKSPVVIVLVIESFGHMTHTVFIFILIL